MLSLTACSDPGIIAKVPEEDSESQLSEVNSKERMSKCNICHVYRPRGAKHCYECNICVLELDRK